MNLNCHRTRVGVCVSTVPAIGNFGLIKISFHVVYANILHIKISNKFVYRLFHGNQKEKEKQWVEWKREKETICRTYHLSAFVFPPGSPPMAHRALWFVSELDAAQWAKTNSEGSENLVAKPTLHHHCQWKQISVFRRPSMISLESGFCHLPESGRHSSVQPADSGEHIIVRILEVEESKIVEKILWELFSKFKNAAVFIGPFF